MIKNSYRLQLATPAFLGDADQKGAWRTPPLKALIREWWRIAVAPEVGYDVAMLKAREKALFGTAADDSREGNHKSQIRLALKHWNEGGLSDWGKVNPSAGGKPGGDPKVKHPEVQFGGGMVGSQLYLGYGPLVLEKGNPNVKLKKGAALQAEEENTLTLAHLEANADELQRALALAHWFGTIGGRSRNGWGSLAWEALTDSPTLPVLSKATLEQTGCARPLTRCLELDWPHAIGSDGKSVLVWQGKQTFANWRDAMKFLAQTKIDFRVALGFNSGDNSPKVEPRHVIAYPVTKHHVAQWGRNVRLANTLRFKLQAESDGTLHALIYHTPCMPTLLHHGIDVLDTWQRVHRHLDANPQLIRLA
jgi:CRISPR-associated protein Cmr1